MDIVKAIQKIESRNGVTIIAIDGYGGSGKSTLAKLLADKLDAVIVHTDDFSQPDVLGWDYERFQTQVLRPLLQGRQGRYQRYDWDKNRLAQWHTVPVKKIVIVEGVSAFRVELGRYWDYAVYVTCPYDVRLKRGVARDGESMRTKWTDVWMPEEELYFQNQRPDLKADTIVDGTLPFNI